MLARRLHALLIILIACPLSTTAVLAQQTITFDHARDSDRTYTLNLKDREQFTIQIENTCESMFTYEIRSLEPEPPVAGLMPLLTTKELSVTHDDIYGGYVVLLTRNGETECEGGKALQDRVLTIYVRSSSWALAFGGGFTVRSLTDPAYALQPHPSVTDARRIIAEPDKRDDFSLGVATLAHVYHTRRPWLAVTFGLGIQEPAKTEYYLGPSIRLGDKMTVSLGVVLGAESRLPAGVNMSQPVFDDNILSDLPRKSSCGWFLALSYSFLQAVDQLKKPFAGSNTGG
ncbi:hypothetical protein [Candidatus Palauibacter sp.]|uniref:hypothetical protein n=1 Tax=Candidatus Palauibacter sp. TaxID=3101350 RepID=UPI003B5AB4FC